MSEWAHNAASQVTPSGKWCSVDRFGGRRHAAPALEITQSAVPFPTGGIPM
jgi:hypothetical protein